MSLHEQLRELADDLSQDPRRLLIEAADRRELVEGLYEDQLEITRNWKLAAEARWDRIKRLEQAGDVLKSAADAADDDIGEHLQVANYNLHGLLNTGERIEPPNPPERIHQAGIDVSVAVRKNIRKALIQPKGHTLASSTNGLKSSQFTDEPHGFH